MRLVVLVIAAVFQTGTLVAQTAAPVLLRLHPSVGDTLHTTLEQQTEMTATTPGNSLAPSRSVTTTVAIHSRTIVRSVQAATSTVLTIVDSAHLASTDAHAAAMYTQAQHSLEGQLLLLELGADGAVESARDIHGVLVPHALADAMASMPAVFPKGAVAVGGHWTREMPLPSGGPLGARGAGHVRATFHFDSLQKGGGIAYVSMRGDILPDSASHGVELSGTVAGSMQLDRSRGWLTDSKFVVLLKSIVTPPVAMGVAPMRFVTRVTQRLRTMDKR
ncbi:hypothetical protein BH09GEM1_BH09GEM1_16540 [soil metagenome]